MDSVFARTTDYAKETRIDTKDFGQHRVTPFDLLSAYLTAAWRDNLRVEATGYCGNNIMYDTTNTLSATSPTLVTFNYYGVSEVEFITFGGTPHSGYASQHYQLVMDNLLVATHESPILSPELRAARPHPALLH